MQTGNRWAGKANPRDLTKTRQQQLLAAQAARKAAADIDVEEVRREAQHAGFDAGFDAGHDAGWSAAIEWVTENFDVLDKDEDQADEADED